MPDPSLHADKVDSRRVSGTSAEYDFHGGVELVCESDRMKKVLSLAERVAPTDTTVLIQGESGTGKEMLARHIHRRSSRARGDFVAINCGALAEGLLESELFGHERGAFTGALERRQGLFELADGGTVFLDEVGEMSPGMQVKVLRVLQSREFRRLGGTLQLSSDVRILAASNRDLGRAVMEDSFRLDLYYRLNVVRLALPPLRDRPRDIPVLAEHFSRSIAASRGLERKGFTPGALGLLAELDWDGNVRELENLVERLALLCDRRVITEEDVLEHRSCDLHELQGDPGDPSADTLDEVKKRHIIRILCRNGGNRGLTARQLGINVKTLYNLVRRFEIEV